jgi:hypothetical protein
MQWQKAAPTRVYFKVTLDGSLNPPSDITAQVQAMVQSVFNGNYDGIVKARIGATINAGKYYARLFPSLLILSGYSLWKFLWMA